MPRSAGEVTTRRGPSSLHNSLATRRARVARRSCAHALSAAGVSVGRGTSSAGIVVNDRYCERTLVGAPARTHNDSRGAPTRPYSAGLHAVHAVVARDVRRAIQDAGYAFLRDRLPLAPAAAKLAAAARRLDERPVPNPDRGFFLQPPPRDADLDAALRRLVPPAAPDLAGMRRVLKGMRLEMLDLRRRLDRAVRRNGAPPVTVQRRSDGYAGARPRVTPVYNYAHHVGAALDSLLASRVRSWEIVVVDDGSQDDSVARVEAWMDRHPHVPALLVRHPVNRRSRARPQQRARMRAR